MTSISGPVRNALSITAFVVVVAGCSSSDERPPSGSGPAIISLGTNVNRLTAGETVRFVAVVTETSGLSNLVGGDLSSPDGKIKYGGFQAAQQGTYSLDLTWDQIQQAQAIDFASEEQRGFVAQFYNVNGEKAAKTVTLQLHCAGRGAWQGQCLAEGSPCAAGKVFVQGACTAGCYVGGALAAPDMINAGNTCQSCQPATALDRWSSVPDVTSCAGGSFCYAGSCAVKFHAQTNTIVTYLTAVWGANANEVFAVGGSILHTVDGGTTWTPQTKPTDKGLSAVWGSSANDVFAVGDAGTILHTTDGGRTWTPQISRTTSNLRGVWGSSATQLYAVGHDGTVLRTFDAGETWEVRPVAPVGFLSGVWGVSASELFAVGSDFENSILHSTDGGTTWTRQTLPQGASSVLLDVWGSSASSVFAVGESGTIVHTSDGGATWTQQTSGTTLRLSSIWGASATDLFAVGSGGTILRTSNGGATWTRQPSPGMNDVLAGVWGSATTNVFAVGGQGTTPAPIVNNR